MGHTPFLYHIPLGTNIVDQEVVNVVIEPLNHHVIIKVGDKRLVSKPGSSVCHYIYTIMIYK